MSSGFEPPAEALFRAARERAPEDRAAFLDEACGENEVLRRAVESLLGRDASAVSATSTPFIEPTALQPLSPSSSEEGEDLPEGGRIGAYRLIAVIGRGGMGAVYLAARADDQYQKRVAIKLVKRGMDTDAIVRRFRHERQILANLDHPHIARLLDGGTTESGLPYFVMEYIEGEPIDGYCTRKRLAIGDRLRLFRQVLSAVQYAHQNLVVHRDLKPGNILVTADGTLKLLDFGIAKLLRSETAATQTLTGEWVMTPDYASPEQVRGDVITTASDVYSLGIVLYELLAGHRPYQARGLPPEEMYRVVCHQDPPRPSLDLTVKVDTPQVEGLSQAAARDKIRRQLRGDLDNIVLMALRKEPGRRYSSAEQLSDDIRRHLEGLPVIARRDTFSYRSAKFVGRHRGIVAAAVFSVLSLVAGTVVAVWQARVARVQSTRAEKRFDDVRRLAHSFLFEIHDAIQDLAGSTRARELLVKRGLEYLDSLAGEASGDEALQGELAAAYVKVGDVQGRPGFANLGDRTGALASYRKGLGLYEAVVAARPEDGAARRELASAWDRAGDTLRTLGSSAQALASYRRALELRTRLLDADAKGLEPRRDLATSYQRIADMLAVTGDLAGAADSQGQALGLFEQLASEAPGDGRVRRDVFIGSIKSGDRLGATGDAVGALAGYRKALALAESLSAGDPENARARRELAAAQDKVGNALSNAGVRGEALTRFRSALAIRQSLAARDPANAELKRDLSISQEKIGLLLFEEGNPAAALTSFRSALTLDRKAAESDPADTQARLDLSTTLEYVGNVLTGLGRYDEALAAYAEARESREAVAGFDLANTEVRQSLAGLYAHLGDLHAARAARGAARARPQWQEARGWYERARTIWLDLESRGSLPKSASGEPARLAAEIARCEKGAAP